MSRHAKFHEDINGCNKEAPSSFIVEFDHISAEFASAAGDVNMAAASAADGEEFRWCFRNSRLISKF